MNCGLTGIQVRTCIRGAKHPGLHLDKDGYSWGVPATFIDGTTGQRETVDLLAPAPPESAASPAPDAEPEHCRLVGCLIERPHWHARDGTAAWAGQKAAAPAAPSDGLPASVWIGFSKDGPEAFFNDGKEAAEWLSHRDEMPIYEPWRVQEYKRTP